MRLKINDYEDDIEISMLCKEVIHVDSCIERVSERKAYKETEAYDGIMSDYQKRKETLLYRLKGLLDRGTL